MLHFTPVNRVPLRLEAHFVDNALVLQRRDFRIT